MRIKLLYSPWDLEHFGPQMLKKFKFERYYDPQNNKDKDEPVVVFGCYGRGTKIDIMNHRGLCVIVWSGSDSGRLHERADFVDYCKHHKDRIFHIAHSHWIQFDLEQFGLEYIDRVVLPVNLDGYKFEPQVGTKVYHYGTKQREWFYGTHLMKRLRTSWNKRHGYPGIVITAHGAYSQKELYELYKDCFIGVRLTEHDNMALSCIELGLMGRRSIFNGNIPGAIPYPCEKPTGYDPRWRKGWIYQDDSLMGKVGNMILEANREPDKLLAEEMREFVNEKEDWLNTEFYDSSRYSGNG